MTENETASRTGQCGIGSLMSKIKFGEVYATKSTSNQDLTFTQKETGKNFWMDKLPNFEFSF